MINKNVLFAGLPQTGKTTFMAALWYYIFNRYADQEYIVNTAANEEREYLNTRSIEWSSCEPVFRTSQAVIEKVSISMERKSTGELINLNIPDISGEAFRRQFQSREWDFEFDNVMNGVSGILLFIDPMDGRNRPEFIYHEKGHYRLLGEDRPSPQTAESWSRENVPNQVKLVDFLQMVNYHKPGIVSSIAVIISCWDLVEKTVGSKIPDEWCKLNLPLLYQYLEANNTLFATKYYGVSAQGGSYDIEAEKYKLSSLQPLERIIVVEGNKRSNEILSPILWITNENKN